MLLEQTPNEVGRAALLGGHARFAPVVQVARPATDTQPASLVRSVLAAADVVALGVAVAVAAVVAHHASAVPVLFAALASLTLAIGRPRPLPIRLSALKELPKVAVRLGMCSTVVLPLAAVTGDTTRLALPILFAMVAVASTRAAAYAIVRRRRRLGRSIERAMVVAPVDVASAISRVMLEHPECGLVPVLPEVVDLSSAAEVAPPRPVVHPRALAAEIAQSEARHLILDPGAATDAELSEISHMAVAHGAHLHLLGGWTESMLVPAVDCDDLWGFALFSVRRPTLVSWRLKRALDVGASVGLLLFLSPLLAVAALAVRLTSRGPVLFRQPRVGQHGRIINVLKFRTYPVDHVDSEWSLNNDDCPLAVGRFLRRTSIDELPQLWNILRGDMSLVGPRPERPHFAEPLSARVEGYPDRHRLPMGLTGLAQVQGLWGQTSIDDRVRFDNHYIDHWSLWGDIVITLQTIPELLRRSLRS